MRNWPNENLIQKSGDGFAFRADPGIRRHRRDSDEGLLESALAAPFQTFGGEPVYPSLQAKAAQLGFGLIRNHPFVDGNKRIGAHTMLVFLAVNGIELRYEQQELIDIILSVAAGQIDRQGLLQWILDHE